MAKRAESHRYGNLGRLIDLILELQATHWGLSLKDIMDRYGIKRSTAERYRDELRYRFTGQFEEVNPGEIPKRYRIKPKLGALRELADFSPDELATLRRAIQLLRNDNYPDARVLEHVAAKIGPLIPADRVGKFELTLEDATAAEGLAQHPGPHPKIRSVVVAALRGAMQTFHKVRLSYRSRRDGAVRESVVCPYGFLWGMRHYLVAGPINARHGIPNLYALPNIEKADVISETFERPKKFSLKEFAERSFGVFQEEPFDVIWKFSPEAAADAKEFVFHPTQTVEDQPDGSLIVRFHAGGLIEMAWHLFTWGDQVEVVAPPELKDKLIELKLAGLDNAPVPPPAQVEPKRLRPSTRSHR